MIQPTFTSSRLLLPARPWFIFMTLLSSYAVNLFPSSAVAWLPDWLSIVLAFWSVREPRKVGMGAAFILGIAMDVGQGSLMGQHALAYVLIAYLASSLSRRILWFPIIEQALHLLPIFIFAQLLQLAVRMIGGAEFPGFSFFLAPVIAGMLWLPATYLLLLPQYRPVDRDDNRPI